MKRSIERLLGCACVVGLALLGPRAATAADFSNWSGAELYARFCASCHGADARGEGPVSRELKRGAVDLTRIAARHGGTYPDNWVYRVIDGREYLVAHGPREMPVWGVELWREQGADVDAGRRTEGAIARLVAYLRTLQATRTPEDPAGRGGG
jgi:mono/diheme cytochrome c family protein